MNRRSLIVMLMGVVSALAGLLVATLVAQDRCLDAGGRWNAAARQCELAGGGAMGFGTTAVIGGVVTAVLLAVMLHRAILFFAMRAARQP